MQPAFELVRIQLPIAVLLLCLFQFTGEEFTQTIPELTIFFHHMHGHQVAYLAERFP